jgi:hypothetical protein
MRPFNVADFDKRTCPPEPVKRNACVDPTRIVELPRYHLLLGKPAEILPGAVWWRLPARGARQHLAQRVHSPPTWSGARMRAGQPTSTGRASSRRRRAAGVGGSKIDRDLRHALSHRGCRPAASPQRSHSRYYHASRRRVCSGVGGLLALLTMVTLELLTAVRLDVRTTGQHLDRRQLFMA